MNFRRSCDTEDMYSKLGDDFKEKCNGRTYCYETIDSKVYVSNYPIVNVYNKDVMLVINEPAGKKSYVTYNIDTYVFCLHFF